MRAGPSVPLDGLLTTTTQVARTMGRGRSSGAAREQAAPATPQARATAPLVFDMSSPKQPGEEVTKFKQQVQALQAMLDAVNRTMEQMSRTMQDLKVDVRAEEREPYMNIKDVEKPAKYGGDIAK